jgi:two-component system chemotaxis response regulator CheY
MFDIKMPVLVVDDYQTMVKIIRNLLGQIGFTDIDDASDGAAALARLATRPYGLVISDWHMSPMTGIELLSRIRAEPRYADLRFIMVTAESKTDNALAARRAGVDAFLVKPFNVQTLRQKIQSAFREQKAA